MKKIIFFIIIFNFIILISFNAFAGDFNISSNTTEIEFYISSPDKIPCSEDILLSIYPENIKNKNRIEKIFIELSDLVNDNGEIIPSNELKIINNKELNFNISVKKSIAYYPPGNYKGRLLIANGIYSIPIFIEIKPFAYLDINKDKIFFNLDKPATHLSNKEKIKLNVETNLKNWELIMEFPDGFIHEDQSSRFPLENIFYSREKNIKRDSDILKANFKTNPIISIESFNYLSYKDNSILSNKNKAGHYYLDLYLWADIKENWNRVKAGEYIGEIYFTFINKN
ncbi:MAG: hypothetical protein ACOCRX_02395 [Candidatus Woesearchaeota archaeon]